MAAFPAEREGLAHFFRDAASHGKDGYIQYQMLSDHIIDRVVVGGGGMSFSNPE